MHGGYNMAYENYFKLSWYNIPPILIAFTIVGLIATVMVVISIRVGFKNKALSAVIGSICALIAIFGWSCLFLIVDGEITYVAKYYSGDYQQVTGVVQNYSETGNRVVSYEVEGIKFTSSPATLAFGYFPTNGGIVNKDGMSVDIKYISDETGVNAIVELNCIEDEIDKSLLDEIKHEQIKQILWVTAVIVVISYCIIIKFKQTKVEPKQQ